MSLFIIVVLAVGRKFLLKLEIDAKLLIIVGLTVLASHFILDIFTYREDVLTSNAHLYFWPIWNLSFHFNAFFHQSVYPNIYTVRIIIEIIYTGLIGIYILFYQWAYRKENPFFMINPKLWLDYLPESVNVNEFKRSAYSLSIVILFIFGLIATGMVAYF